MIQLTDIALRTYFKRRQKNIEKVLSDPSFFQSKVLKRIIKLNQDCQYGKKWGFEKIEDYSDFKNAVPLVQYNDLEDDIKSMMDGQSDLLTKAEVKWFAKSSGTSNNRSKFIPVTKNYLLNGHLKCAWDAASFIYSEDQRAKLFADKTFIMGGSIKELGEGRVAGDISAIILHNFPKIGRRFYTPDFDTALMDDWDEKIKKMAVVTSKENVTLFAGVPSWSIVLFNELLDYTGANNISEIWPNLKSYLHGGVGFAPYEKKIRELIPSKSVKFREVYNASEGYFAMQNNYEENGMTLMFDHEIFYEFIPLTKYTSVSSECISLEDVSLDTDYVLVISNTSGLYRYIIGDIIEFTQLKPFKIKVKGRIEQSINVFGEELMVCNTDQALASICKKFGVEAREYSVAPVFMEGTTSGQHEWVVELDKEIYNPQQFESDLDKCLCSLNSDYDAKRSHDLVLRNLRINFVPPKTFEKWLREKGKYGGQNKVPRLSNTRKHIESILTHSLKAHNERALDLL